MKTFICWCKLGIFLSNDWPSINPHLLKHVLKQEHRPTTPKLRLRVSHIFLSHKVSKLSQIDILVCMEKIIRISLAKHIFFFHMPVMLLFVLLMSGVHTDPPGRGSSLGHCPGETMYKSTNDLISYLFVASWFSSRHYRLGRMSHYGAWSTETADQARRTSNSHALHAHVDSDVDDEDGHIGCNIELRSSRMIIASNKLW